MSRYPDLAQHEGGCFACGRNAADCTCVRDALEENAERGHIGMPHPVHGGEKPCDPEDPCDTCKRRIRNLARTEHCREEAKTDLFNWVEWVPRRRP